MDKELSEITIAAYLHDVGKFAQRADIKELYDEKMEPQVLKVQKGGYYSHNHALYTFGFMEKHRNVFPDGLDVVAMRDFAAMHHSPSKYEEWIIAQGDRLSSGSDRCNLFSAENPQVMPEGAKFYEKPMLHIPSTVQIPGGEKPQAAFCKMRPLEGDAILASKTDRISQNDYRELWNQFEKDFVKLEKLSAEDFIAALDSLLERYWWCIPSATNSDADISLYQHAKTTAAFASALYLYHKESGSETEQALGNNAEEKFRFVKGDVSGIQKYIFDLKSTKDSAKLLRAKSFQIAALGDILSGYLVGQFGLSKANVLTAAGGNFIVLLPNTDGVKNTLPQIQLEIEEYFLQEFAGKLAVILSDGGVASQKDVQKENAPGLINKIGYDGDVAKQKKMQKALQKNGAVLSALYDDLQKNGECPQCGTFPARGLGGDGEALPCKNCEKLSDIGRDLVKSSFLKIDCAKLSHFGNMVKVSRTEKGKGWASINDFAPGHPIEYQPYTAPWKDENAGEILTFEEIAKKSTGNKKLAMFKADIDNLGLLFSSGLGERISFSRYADMSHMMHNFFSAYYTYFVNTHSYNRTDYTDGNKETESVLYKDAIYTVFSGGDDLCVLGPWDAVLQFASDFEKELGKFTAGNKSVHISAGIALASPNVPVKNIAEEAEEALELSKARKADGKIVKNALTVFGTTVGWDEYEKLLADGKKIQVHLESTALSTAVIYKMIDFANRAKAIDGGSVEARNFLWAANLHYVVSRNIKDKDLREWLLSLGENKDKIMQSRIAVSYGLYTQRNN